MQVHLSWETLGRHKSTWETWGDPEQAHVIGIRSDLSQARHMVRDMRSLVTPMNSMACLAPWGHSWGN
jgi:hypothetical protein